jgi:hypothetical protein
MKSLVDELNEALPNLNLSLNEQTGLLNKQKSEVNELIDANLEYYKVKAAQDSLVEIAKEQYDAESKLTSLQDEMNQKILDTFSKKLSELPVLDVQSVSKAYLIAKPYLEVQKDAAVNDKLFRKYYDFYNNVFNNIKINEEDEYYLIKYGEKGDKNPIDPSDETKYPRLKAKVDELKLNGFRFIYPEGMPQTATEYKYLLSNFSDYVSDGIREYLTINKNEQLEVPIIEDAGLAVTWDDLAARIIIWENFINKYPMLKEVKYVKDDIDTYLKLYCGRIPLDNSPVFNYDTQKLNDDVKQSYERFMTNYATSKYTPIIKQYYNILKKNNFIFNDEADKFLDKNNIKKVGN